MMIGVSFSRNDISQLEQCYEALLTPLVHATPDSWRSSVMRAARPLLGADSVSFQLPLPEIEFMCIEPADDN